MPESNLISQINIERKITCLLNGGGGKGKQSERVSGCGSPPGPLGGDGGEGKLIFQKWRLLLVCDLHGSGNGGGGGRME